MVLAEVPLGRPKPDPKTDALVEAKGGVPSNLELTDLAIVDSVVPKKIIGIMNIKINLRL